MTSIEMKARMWEIMFTQEKLAGEYQRLLKELSEMEKAKVQDAPSAG